MGACRRRFWQALWVNFTSESTRLSVYLYTIRLVDSGSYKFDMKTLDIYSFSIYFPQHWVLNLLMNLVKSEYLHVWLVAAQLGGERARGGTASDSSRSIWVKSRYINTLVSFRVNLNWC